MSHLGDFEQLVLLGLLHLDGVGYGMQVRREIETRAGRDVSIGAIYATLERLEKKGLLSSAVKDNGSGRSRRLYRINGEGMRALEAARNTYERMTSGLEARWKTT